MFLLNKKIISFKLRFVVIMGLALGAFALQAKAQDEATPAEILKKALQAMEAGKYAEAADTMYMYLGMVEDSDMPRVIAIAQDIRFKLATILIQDNRLDEAASVLQDYIDKPLADKPRQAMKMLATCYFEIEDFENAATAVTNAIYYNENPVIEAKKGSSEEDGGMEMYESKEEEPEYTQDELTTLYMTLAESYFNLKKFEDCIPPFSYVIEHTPNEQRKGYAIMQVINALLEIPAFDRILDWVPQLYRTDARYDIRVNLALMNAAAALYDAGEYDSALPLYRMIVPRDELIAFQKKKIREMREAYGLPPDEGSDVTEDDILLFGGDDEEDASATEDVVIADEENKPKELLELEQLIEALEALPPYEMDIKYRQADLYKTVDRYWEGLKFFDIVYTSDPTTDIGERSIYELVDILIENLGDIEEAKKRGYEYLSKFNEGVTPRQIAYMLTGHFQGEQNWAEVKPIKQYLDTFVRTNDMTITKYDAELYFMQAVADLVLQHFPESEKGFKYLLDEYPKSHQEANATYWYAMSQLFQQKWSEALPTFDSYIKQFPSQQYVDECWYQGGVALFGLEDYSNAMVRFTHVIDTYPDSSVYPEACSMRGDLHGASDADNGLDLAIEDYERAYGASTRVQQSSYATFQATEVYAAEDKYDDILRVVERYEQDWGERGGDVAKALYWIGKAKIQKKEYTEAAATYVEAIVKYGGDLRQDGVDSMISELVKMTKIYLKPDEKEWLKNELTAAEAEAEALTLQLRLRVTLAKMENTELELGAQLLEELPNLDNASPPVLACICDASFEKEDYSRAEELLTIFINKFEDSDFMRAAYKLRAFGQVSEKDYDGALSTINDAQALYGTDYDVAWAQLMKAQVLLAQGRIDGDEGARQANLNILNVRAWRGTPVAQATYQLGQVEEAAGNLKKAFGFYQRTYFQYRGHDRGKWAAEAYLSSARVLEKMGPEYADQIKTTYQMMLYDRFVNRLPQADIAREKLDAGTVADIKAFNESGAVTNITIKLEFDSPPMETTQSEAEGSSVDKPVSTEEGA